MPFDPSLTAEEVTEAFRERFAEIRVLSSGGQGAVFRAEYRDESGRRNDVALKIYFPDHLEERAAREVRALRGLTVPSIARLHTAGRTLLRGRQCFYLATQYISGRQLQDIIATGPQGARIAADVGLGIAEAIGAVWAQRIVHRDIKPANIIIADDGDPILIDLGIARHLALDSITTAGGTWGTSGYMSPEHARARRQLSCKTDVFSLGVVLQEILAGRHPTGGNQAALLAGGPSTALIVPGCPPLLVSIIDSMVQPRAERRPTPAEVIEQFEPIRGRSS